MDMSSLIAGLIVGFAIGCIVTLWQQSRSEYSKLHKEFLEEKARIKREIAESKARMDK